MSKSILRPHPKFLTLGFWIPATLGLVLIGAAYFWIGTHYLIGFDPQRDLCLNLGRFFLVEYGRSSLWRGDLVAFRADERMQPFFPPGTLMVKRLVGLPGDRVTIDAKGIAVNGQLLATTGLVNAEKLKRKPEEFYREILLLPDHYFVIGERPKSFDSRYFGPLEASQIVGKAYPIPYLTEIFQWIFEKVAPAQAAEEIDLDGLKALRDRTRRIQSQADSLVDLPQNVHTDQAERLAKELVGTFQTPNEAIIGKVLETVGPESSPEEFEKQAKDWLTAVFNQTKQESNKRRFLILVSSSLGEERLKELFSAYAGQEEVQFAFQGLGKGQKIEDFAATVHDWIRKMDPPPNVSLDPLVFKHYGITHVPVLLALEGERLLARVDGLVNVEWLKETLASWKGKLPLSVQHGQVVAIAERNLMDVIEERMAAIDWEDKRKKALEKFWTYQEKWALPPASRDKKRLIDMRVKVPQDIFAPDGRLIARAGDVLNPLEKVPFRQALIVFDATRGAEIEWATSVIHEVARDGLTPVLIATRLPEGKEWETIETIERNTGFPVYLLPGVVKERFEIEHTPSLITPHDAIFMQVAEFKLCESCS